MRRLAKISILILVLGLVSTRSMGTVESAEHWAFVAPQRPALPVVRNRSWVKSPIDNFVLAKLEARGLAPSPETDRETLIRRVSLDLTGLPPTIEEIDAFVADRSPKAYEKLVDRLLASPHYGEKWGRWWLDAARYADTNGFEKDRERSIWKYRDWVTNAFNRDMPFNQFTIEQLAGDMLPGATIEQRVATGFLRNSMLNEEGAIEPELFRIEGLIDRVDAIGKAFLGLTINCTQCHTHKFDPIKHEEYYRFYAFLNQDVEPDLEVPTEAESRKRAEIQAGVAKIEDELVAKTPDLDVRLARWEEQMRGLAGDWRVLEGTDVFGTSGVRFEKLLDGSFIPRGDNPTTVAYYFNTRTDLRGITGIRLELLTDPTLPRTGPGRASQGTALLSELVVEAAPAGQPDKFQPVPIASGTADFESADRPIRLAFDGVEKTSWGTDAGPGLRNQDRRAVFTFREPVGGDPAGTVLRVTMHQKEFGGGAGERFEAQNIGRFRLAVTTAPAPRADPLPPAVRRILDIPVAQRTAGQRRAVFSAYRLTVPEWESANQSVTQLLRQWPYPTTTLVVAPHPVGRETRVFKRGDWKRQGELVTPGTPEFLHPFPSGAPQNRLGLAMWLADVKNPLTPRVIVNRIWQSYFGEGLVTTPEDFGTRCETPVHQQLLEWLAVEFRDGSAGQPAWSIKNVHRQIVLSATYRQSSRLTPQLEEVDPNNRLLARMPRLRVEAETIRDLTLAASGLLSRKVGGPPVFPPIPDGALAVSFRSRSVWETSQGEDRYRRGLYTFWKRSVPYPSMSVFDAPSADVACTRRARSNSPLQALTTLNDAAFVEAAQALALRIWRQGGADDLARLRYGFRLCTGRLPDDFELARLQALLEKQRGRFAGETAAAVYVSASDLNSLPKGIDLHQLAPWTIVARTMLNLDETITRQ
jgi:hypothetical protein